MKIAKILAAIVVAGIGICVHSAGADTIAYSTNNLTGNQTYAGNLGLDFNVISAIQITSVGVYDDSANGIATPIRVGIFRRLPGGNPNTDHAGVVIASTVQTISGSGDPLIDGYRFRTLPGTVYLTPGFYTIDTVGFGGANFNGNENIASPPFSVSTDSGGGLIQFVGTG